MQFIQFIDIVSEWKYPGAKQLILYTYTVIQLISLLAKNVLLIEETFGKQLIEVQSHMLMTQFIASQ